MATMYLVRNPEQPQQEVALFWLRSDAEEYIRFRNAGRGDRFFWFKEVQVDGVVVT